MPKDCFGKYTPIRHTGWEHSIKINSDTKFVLHYVRSETACFGVILDVEGQKRILLDIPMSFCLACGRFLGFGFRYEICWICQDSYENLEGDENL